MNPGSIPTAVSFLTAIVVGISGLAAVEYRMPLLAFVCGMACMFMTLLTVALFVFWEHNRHRNDKN